VVRYNLVICLLNSGLEDQALAHIESLLQKQADNAHYLATKGFILLRQAKTETALPLLQRALAEKPYDNNTLIVLAMTLSSQGFHERAEWFLRKARKRYPKNLIVYLGLLQNAHQMADSRRVDAYLKDLTNNFTLGDIRGYLNQRVKGYRYISGTLVPIDDRIVMTRLGNFINQRAAEMGE